MTIGMSPSRNWPAGAELEPVPLVPVNHCPVPSSLTVAVPVAERALPAKPAVSRNVSLLSKIKSFFIGVRTSRPAATPAPVSVCTNGAV